MKKFIKKIIPFLLIGGIPILCLGVIYYILDPFKVIKTYDSYFQENVNGRIGLNKDYVSTINFINNNESKDYNSFIFGNSRSMFYEINDWSKYLDSNSNCYHFDASAETLFALGKKIEFIDKQGNSLNNILLVLDYSTIIEDKPREEHLFVISPPLVQNSNWFTFHKTFFTTFLNPKFLFVYLDFVISGQVKPYMEKSHIINNRPINYDSKTNEIRLDYVENLISENKYYTAERMSVFFKRDLRQKYSPQCIFESQKEIFTTIKTIADKQNSNLKVIISPVYNQKKLDEKDLAYLESIFGKNNVFDFSGINKFTEDYTNYYENVHYRPHVASEIMEIVYKGR